MAIVFQNKLAVYTPNTTVAFPAQIDGVDVTCEISAEALEDHFGASSNKSADLLAAFDANRAAIEKVARIRLPERIQTGRCLLKTEDF